MTSVDSLDEFDNFGGLDGEAVAQRVEESIGRLAAVVEPDLPGWSRPVFSEPYRQSRELVASMMRAAGLQTTIDRAGNIVGRLCGTGNGPPVVIGSHTDTVVGGGRFDGIAGVVAAIEVAELLQRQRRTPNHDVVVVDFLGEEANLFGSSCVGSRAIAGQLTSNQLAQTNHHGYSLGDAMESFGIDTSAVLATSWPVDGIHAFVELHVEQGPTLERAECTIGVVTAIAGIERITATFAGRADHAGTMPMDERLDALAAAAEAVLSVERTGCGAPVPAVATTGRLESSPGSFNVIPDQATIWAELRSADQAWLTGARRNLAEQIVADAERRGIHVDLDLLIDQAPVPTTPNLQDLIGASADKFGLAWSAVPSGAGHDAAHMAHLGPMAMIFVPSRGGRSHCPEEWTDTAHIVSGVQVLAETVRRLDAMADVSSITGG